MTLCAVPSTAVHTSSQIDVNHKTIPMFIDVSIVFNTNRNLANAVGFVGKCQLVIHIIYKTIICVAFFFFGSRGGGYKCTNFESLLDAEDEYDCHWQIIRPPRLCGGTVKSLLINRVNHVTKLA